MMQTRIPAPTEANKQQSHSAQQPAQLLAGQQSAFADHRHQAAQLTSLQAKMNGSAQAQQMRTQQAQIAGGGVAQRESLEEPLQAQVDGEAVQREEAAAPSEAPKPNNTGLPDNLKSGIESLSGMSMDHVKVHYNSSQPAQLNAHAYAQGSEIHVAPGQEQHVPHEAWHVVQQAQGRVKPTMQMKMGVPVNDDAGLETEADVMGARALEVNAIQAKIINSVPNHSTQSQIIPKAATGIIQRQSLSKSDKSYSVSNNGEYEWIIQWELSDATTAKGWIVQEVEATYDVKDKDDEVIDDDHDHFMEAWEVNSGKKITSYAEGGDVEDDTFTDPDYGVGSKGSITVAATAAYYEGDLPNDFAENNPSTQAGILPSTTTIHGDLLGGPSTPHNLEATWDSSDEEKQTNVVKE